MGRTGAATLGGDRPRETEQGVDGEAGDRGDQRWDAAGDHEFLEQRGGWHPARERWFELEKLPEANLAEGVTIDECSTYRATRFAVPV